MSDTPQGPDWWQASDDKWYPPPRPEMPGDPAAVGAPSGAAAPAGPPTGPPMAPPGGFPPGPGSGGFPPAGGPSGGFPPAGPPGPYGAPSGPQAPGSGQNKTPLYIAIGAVAVALVVILVVVLSGGGDDDEPTTSPTTEQPPTTEDPSGGGTSPPTTEAGSGGSTSGSAAVDGLEVTDSGASNTGYGFIIENTSDEARVNFTVDVAIYDTNDTVITNDSHSVGRINAGESLGIGYDIVDEIPGGVGRLEFSFEEGYEDSAPEGSFTVSGVSTQTDEYSTETTFTVASSYEIDLETTYAYAIYRDSAGAIIGGTYGFVDLIPAGGQAAGTVTSYEPVAGVATTDVYVDQGYF